VNRPSALLLQPDGHAQPLVPGSCLCACSSARVAPFKWHSGLPKLTTVHELQSLSASHFEQHSSGVVFGSALISGKKVPNDVEFKTVQVPAPPRASAATAGSGSTTGHSPVVGHGPPPGQSSVCGVHLVCGGSDTCPRDTAAVASERITSSDDDNTPGIAAALGHPVGGKSAVRAGGRAIMRDDVPRLTQPIAIALCRDAMSWPRKSQQPSRRWR
jgi:hypothetical protein